MNAALHDEMIVVDALQYSNWDRALFEELRAGGLTAVHVTIAYWEDARATLSAIGRWHRLFRRFDDLIMPVHDGEDIVAAKRNGKTGIILGFQNCSPIEDELAMVEILQRLGVRVMQLTYNNQSLLGAGCYESEDAGITRFGREVIREMNRVGMIIDMSHSAERTTLEAIELSDRPIAITHANPSSFHPALRNKSDAVMRALAETGGMLGFSLYPFHLKDGGDCTLEAFCDMAWDAAELMGVDHVGIGSDMCRNWDYRTLEWMRSGRWTFEADYGEGSAAQKSWPAQPPWFRTPADMPNLTAGLLARGFAETDVAKIMGGNWLRFFTDGFRSADTAAG